jgi:hypothetical protein
VADAIFSYIEYKSSKVDNLFMSSIVLYLGIISLMICRFILNILCLLHQVEKLYRHILIVYNYRVRLKSTVYNYTVRGKIKENEVSVLVLYQYIVECCLQEYLPVLRLTLKY